MSGTEEQIKIVVISALREELAYLLAKEELNWQSPRRLTGKYSYRLGTLKNQKGQTCQIAAVPQSLNEMGLIDAAILSTIAISLLKPEYIVLIGICGGIKGEVNIGDIIIPRQAFHYQNGKLQGSGEIKKGLINEQADGIVIDNIVNFFEQEYNPNKIIQDAIEKQGVRIGHQMKILNIPPPTSLKVHFLNMASADLVNDHPTSIENIRNQWDRKAIAFDMESVAVLKAAKELGTKAFIIKSVSDIPTDTIRREEQEKYREFVKFVATEAFYNFATKTDFFFA